MGGMDPASAKALLTERINEPLILALGNNYYQETFADLGLEYDLDKAVEKASDAGKENFISSAIQLFKSPFYKQEVVLETRIDQEKYQKFTARLRADIDQDVQTSYVEAKEGQLKFVEGKDGLVVDQTALDITFRQKLAAFQGGVVKIPVAFVSAGLKEPDGQLAVGEARKFLGRKITISFGEKTWILGDSQIIPMLTFSKNGALKIALDEAKVSKYVTQIAQEVNQDTQEPKLTIENGKAQVFKPSQDGLKLDQEKTKKELTLLLITDQKSDSLTLSVLREEARVKTEEINDLGIKEIVGRGASNFAGSSAERIFNIELASSKINGTLVAPNDTFSFNRVIGDISAATGYKTAYIIERGRTLFGAGGGVCQVSTTAFRAALYSGLPLVERHTHAYRVRYYEQAGHPVGLDATIYTPSVDFKFKNDTQNWILITTEVNRKLATLTFEFWGTKDGRTVEISKPQVSGLVKPPDPLYEDDPTLPKGVTKQADFAAWGAYVKVKRKVVRDGQDLISEEIISRYRPWQAVFKVGTGS